MNSGAALACHPAQVHKDQGLVYLKGLGAEGGLRWPFLTPFPPFDSGWGMGAMGPCKPLPCDLWPGPDPGTTDMQSPCAPAWRPLLCWQ